MPVRSKRSEAHVTDLFTPIKAVGLHNVRCRSGLGSCEILGRALRARHGGQRRSPFLGHFSWQSVWVILLADSVRSCHKCWPWLAHQWSCWGTGSLEVWEIKRNPSRMYFLGNNQQYWLLNLSMFLEVFLIQSNILLVLFSSCFVEKSWKILCFLSPSEHLCFQIGRSLKYKTIGLDVILCRDYFSCILTISPCHKPPVMIHKTHHKSPILIIFLGAAKWTVSLSSMFFFSQVRADEFQLLSIPALNPAHPTCHMLWFISQRE